MSQTSTAMSQASTSAIDKHPHEIKLDSIKGTKIHSVKLYSNRAEITRVFTVDIKKGHNQLVISQLPKVVDKSSLRAEGPSGTTIYGPIVSIMNLPSPPSKPATSDSTSKLIDDKKRIERALERAKKSLPPIETYLGFLKIEPLDATALREAVKSYETAAKELDDVTANLEKELAEINTRISDEKENMPTVDANLNLKASIGLFAESDCKDEKISLIYAVTSATWNAEYDIHVDTTSIRGPVVTLTYKANITQKTGENWDQVLLMLETASPLCLEVPTLTPWKFATHRERPKTVQNSSAKSSTSTSISIPGKTSSHRIQWKKHRAPLESSNEKTEECRQGVSSKGNLGVNFEVSGLISIESGGTIIHNQTITKERLDVEISRVCVPKKDTKVYKNAKIKNTSKYTFLSGQASVYVDGNFISKSDVPLVGPGEKFDCPLGVDNSLRVTYYPRTTTVTKTHFYFRPNTTYYTFNQRIKVCNGSNLNPDPTPIIIIDQIHVADREDPDAMIRLRTPKVITVELLKPPLKTYEEILCASEEPCGKGTLSVPEALGKMKVQVEKGVLARWHGADKAEVQAEAFDLGKDGKLNWECTVEKEVTLDLTWKMSVPMKSDIMGFV
ncbi:hypothetical protein BYT27DRAFT_7201277 [Phlegmacium glaucopus]|nr:hypothetical protein BYT27DRAFT_7201277 [Phlegmacium glaucopus]